MDLFYLCILPATDDERCTMRLVGLAAFHYEKEDWPEAIAAAAAVQKHMAPTGASPQWHISPETGSWEGEQAEWHHMHDGNLSKALVEIFEAGNVRTVVDFGCGMGLYVRDFRAAGLRAVGFDGNPDTLKLSQGRCFHADLSREVDAGTRFDMVMSLEVAEHIPPQHEQMFIDNICNHVTTYAIISW